MAEPQQESGIQRRERAEPSAPVEGQRLRPPQRVTVPADIYENDNEYLIIADMPGLAKDDFEVVVRGDRLELRGMRMVGNEQLNYERSFALPQNADTQNIAADYRDGVVKVTVPKTQESRPRRIPVRA